MAIYLTTGVSNFLDNCDERWKHPERRNTQGHSEIRDWALWTLEDINESTRPRAGEGFYGQGNQYL